MLTDGGMGRFEEERAMHYIIDDDEAVRAFIGTLNRKVLRRRFSAGSAWEPDYTVLAVHEGKAVALADCVTFSDIGAANASLLAAPGFGAHALAALLHLKRLFPADHWQSTLRIPTPSTIAISRRYFDSTLDQATWELSSKLVETHGPQDHLRPTPLVVSRSALTAHGLPPLSRWGERDRAQLLSIAGSPQQGFLASPAGYSMHATELMALSFELLDIAFDVRQQVSRFMLVSLAAAHGHNVTPLLSDLVKPAAMSAFFERVRPYAGGDPKTGLFAFSPMDPQAMKRSMEAVIQGRLPSTSSRPKG